MAKELLDKKRNVNNLATLLEVLCNYKENFPNAVLAALKGCNEFFAGRLEDGTLTLKAAAHRGAWRGRLWEGAVGGT